MFGTTVIDEALTFEKFGYYSKSLSRGSLKKVILKCNECGLFYEKRKKDSHYNHKCSVIKGNTKRCSICKEWKTFSEFYKCKKFKIGLSSQCIYCHKTDKRLLESRQKSVDKRCRIYREAFKNNIELYIKNRIRNISVKSRKEQIPFNLDFKYLLECWKNQNGKCYYSGIEMKSEGLVNGYRSWNAPSLDKKDPKLGYIKGNVIWCCANINTFKCQFTDLEFIELVNKIKWRKINEINV